MRRLFLVCCLLTIRALAQSVLPGTHLLTDTSDPAVRMVDDIHAYLDRERVEAAKRRAAMSDGGV